MIIDMPTVSMGNTSGSILPAERVSYDNTVSGLEADNVQDAVDGVYTYFSSVAKKDLTSLIQNATAETGIGNSVSRIGNICIISMAIKPTVTTANTDFLEMPVGYRAITNTYCYPLQWGTLDDFSATIAVTGKDNAGKSMVRIGGNNWTVNTRMLIYGVYITDDPFPTSDII